jgi:hypothetical protein
MLPQIFYLLKHILLFYLVIFKLYYNNLVFTLIMSLYFLYVCLYILIENLIIDLKTMDSSFLR